MLERVTVRARDPDASARVYAAVLESLDLALERTGDGFACEEFSLEPASEANPPTGALHIAFGAPSRDHVDAAWRAATAGGARDDGPPGPRPEYRDDYYGAFVLDPDGNGVEAVHHGAVRGPGVVDHLWIRVADVAAARAFYSELAPHAGLRHGTEAPDRAQFVGAGGSFSLVAGPPVTEHAALAFPADVDRSERDPDGNVVVLVAGG
jgi:catechol 2,3-dioxygenase-like lactoylglutathione lyase family enzyme